MLLKYVFSELTDVGQVRKVNEDNLGSEKTSNGHLFVVCDGMGGHNGGATASAMAVRCIIEHISNNTAENYGELIADAISFANFQIHASAAINPELSRMGTTCVVMLLANDNKIYYGHVGDSRIYKFSGDVLQRITKDHSFVQFLVDSGEITEEEMETHPRRNQILKALGTEDNVKASICTEPLLPQGDDLFLLCSDGLTGMITDSVLQTMLQEIPQLGLQTVNTQLIDLANKNGGKDNITSTLIKFDGGDENTTINTIPYFEKKPSRKTNKFLIVAAFLIASFFLLWRMNKNNFTSDNKVKDSVDTISVSAKKDSISKSGTSVKSEELSDTTMEAKKVENKKKTPVDKKRAMQAKEKKTMDSK